MLQFMKCVCTGPEETERFAEGLGRDGAHEVLCLYGDLGAGKTTFVRGLAKALGIESRIISPTFTIQRVHQGEKKLFHFDFYRIGVGDSLAGEELREALMCENAVIAIEWPEKINSLLPEKRTEVYFRYVDELTREITLTVKS